MFVTHYYSSFISHNMSGFYLSFYVKMLSGESHLSCVRKKNEKPLRHQVHSVDGQNDLYGFAQQCHFKFTDLVI